VTSQAPEGSREDAPEKIGLPRLASARQPEKCYRSATASLRNRGKSREPVRFEDPPEVSMPSRIASGRGLTRNPGESA